MKIEWEQHVPSAPDVPFALVASCCQAVEGVTLPLSVHLLITDDDYIHQINRQYRDVDRSTDVLSFPTVNYARGHTARTSAKRLECEMDEGACMLGDILISYPHAQAQAAEYGHSVRRELCYLFAHGLFHLMGYDHMEDDQRKEMRAMEEKAMHMAGISREETAPAATDQELLCLARQAMDMSYSPYSRYAVGAALLCRDGRVFLGCNIENASFGLTNCAERTAVFKAISEGEHDFASIAIAARNSAPWPCGACRQVLNEFAPDIRVLVTWGDGQTDQSSLRDLLPHGFGPKDLDFESM